MLQYGEMKDFILPYIYIYSNLLTFDNNLKIDEPIFKSIDKPLKQLFLNMIHLLNLKLMMNKLPIY